MSQLRKYIDQDGVITFVNPDQIKVVTVNEPAGPAQPYEATVTLVDGSYFMLQDQQDQDLDGLCHRIVAGDA